MSDSIVVKPDALTGAAKTLRTAAAETRTADPKTPMSSASTALPESRSAAALLSAGLLLDTALDHWAATLEGLADTVDTALANQQAVDEANARRMAGVPMPTSAPQPPTAPSAPTRPSASPGPGPR